MAGLTSEPTIHLLNDWSCWASAVDIVFWALVEGAVLVGFVFVAYAWFGCLSPLPLHAGPVAAASDAAKRMPSICLFMLLWLVTA